MLFQSIYCQNLYMLAVVEVKCDSRRCSNLPRIHTVMLFDYSGEWYLCLFRETIDIWYGV